MPNGSLQEGPDARVFAPSAASHGARAVYGTTKSAPGLLAKGSPGALKHVHARARVIINRPFTWLWAAQTTSTVGDYLFDTSLILWISVVLYRGDPHAPLISGAALVVVASATITLGPFGGVAADRYAPATVMFVADLVRFGCMILVTVLAVATPALLHRAVTVSVVLVAVFVATVAGLFFAPARAILLRDVVPDDDLERASSYAQGSAAVAELLGPPTAAPLLISAGPVVAFSVNALSFLFSASAVRRIGTSGRQPAADVLVPRSRRAELRSGFDEAFSNRTLRVIFLCTGITALGTGAFNALDIYFIRSNLHAEAVWFGYLNAVYGAGLLAGSASTARMTRRMSSTSVFSLSLFVIGLCTLVYSRLTAVLPAVPCVFFTGFGLGLLNSAVFPLIIRATPKDRLGRVVAVLNPLQQLSTVLSVLGATVLVTALGEGFKLRTPVMDVQRFDLVLGASAILFLMASLIASRNLAGLPAPSNITAEEVTR